MILKRKKYAVLSCLLAALMICSPLQAEASLSSGNVEDTEDTAEEAGSEESAQRAEYQEQIDELNNRIEELKDQKTELQKKINSAANELEKKMIERSAQQEEVFITEQQIALLEEKITKLEEAIVLKQEEIEEKQKEIDHNFEQYKKRLRATYMAGQSSALSMLLGSSDFTDFLIRSEFVRVTAEHDEMLVQSLRDDRIALETAQEELETSKEEIEVERQELQVVKEEHEAVIASLSSIILDIEEEKAYYQQNKSKIDAEMAQAEKEVERIYELLKPQMSDTFVGGIWAWPLPGHTTITSTYADSGRSDYHTGVDIAGGNCYGKSIVAANDGTVIFTQAGYSGYGHYVIVDHGGGYSSLYAHMSSISVSVGQKVSRGTTEIGKVGATGWATGPHLHFEVRVNGASTNPMAFIS